MALPKLKHPTFLFKLPSNGKEINLRPFTVKEEKILLFAQQDGSSDAILNSFNQLITNCVIDPIDVDEMPSFDIEALFLKLRSISVSNIAKIQIEDTNKEGIQETIELEIDLDKDVVIHNLESTASNKIVLNPEQELGVVLRYPTFKAVKRMTGLDKNDPASGLEMYDDVISTIWEGEEVYDYVSASRAEKNDFLESLSESAVEKIQEFLETMPYIGATIKYKLKDGEERSLDIRGLQSFFG